QAGHQLGGEGKVRVARGVRHAELDALGLRVRTGHRDADGRGAVTGGVGQVDRSLEVLHQAVVAVQRRVGEGKHGVRVLEEAADVPAGRVAELRVAGLVEEQRLAV